MLLRGRRPALLSFVVRERLADWASFAGVSCADVATRVAGFAERGRESEAEVAAADAAARVAAILASAEAVLRPLERKRPEPRFLLSLALDRRVG